MKLSIAILLASMASGVFSININNTTQVNALHRVTINVAPTDNPNQHDCPLPCISHTNPHTWTSYKSVERLRRCQRRMLLQLPLTELLGDTNHTISNSTIYCCTVDENRPATHRMERLYAEYQESGKESASACKSNGIKMPSKVMLAQGSAGGWPHASEAATLLQDLQTLFEDPYNCFQRSFFSQGKMIVVSVWTGDALAKSTIVSALHSLATYMKATGSVSIQTVVELCDSSRSPDRIFGIAVDTVQNLRQVQKIAMGWSRGECAMDRGSRYTSILPGVKVMEIPGHSITGGNIKREADLCISGKDKTTNSGDLSVPKLVDTPVTVVAWDDTNTDMNYLCQFSCKYGFCPEDVCTNRIDGPDMSGPPDPSYDESERTCWYYKEHEHR
ncbi:hypothetical protein CSUB01_12400, partial [Colletotrichum sublineola]